MFSERKRRAPTIKTINSYKLTFGMNKTLEITERAKVVEAMMHNDSKRVTLLYRGLATFTFDLM